jgi:uncharacterized protein YkwD
MDRLALCPPIQEDRVRVEHVRGPFVVISLLWLAAACLATTASEARASCTQHTHKHGCANILVDKSSTGRTRSIPRPAPLAADGACANTSLSPRAGNLPLISAAVLCLINRQRALHGLPPLRSAGSLAEAAQRHSDDMARANRFDHVGSAGDTFGDRITGAGYLKPGRRFSVGENIAWVALRSGTPGAMVADWLASPEHRVNILDPGFRDTGIGLTAAAPSRFTRGVRGLTVTEDFGSLS